MGGGGVGWQSVRWEILETVYIHSLLYDKVLDLMSVYVLGLCDDIQSIVKEKVESEGLFYIAGLWQVTEVFPSRYETQYGVSARVPFYHDDRHRHSVTMCLSNIRKFVEYILFLLYTYILHQLYSAHKTPVHTVQQLRNAAIPQARNTINLKQKRVENTYSKLINSDPYNKSIHHMCTIYDGTTIKLYLYIQQVYILHMLRYLYTQIFHS